MSFIFFSACVDCSRGLTLNKLYASMIIRKCRMQTWAHACNTNTYAYARNTIPGPKFKTIRGYLSRKSIGSNVNWAHNRKSFYIDFSQLNCECWISKFSCYILIDSTHMYQHLDCAAFIPFELIRVRSDDDSAFSSETSWTFITTIVIDRIGIKKRRTEELEFHAAKWEKNIIKKKRTS